MKTHQLLATLLAGSALLSACAIEDTAEDGADDAFVTGKADGGIEEGSWEALSALKVANTVAPEVLSRKVADDGVGLSSTAKRGILAFRNGEDGVAGTSDDQQFTTLAELDAVRYVGPISLQRMIDFAVDHGLAISATIECVQNTPDPTKPSTIEGTWLSSLEEWELSVVAKVNDINYYQSCNRSWAQPTAGIARFGCFYESEWGYFSPAYAIRFPEDVRDRSDAFTVTVIDVEEDARYTDGYRENPGTEIQYTCRSGRN